LRARYESLDDLNRSWGTVFWSHIYNDWSEIPVPLTNCRSSNPGLALDFYRFASDSYVAYQQMQLDILRKKCPQHFITHNLMGFKYDQINYFDLARELDFVTWDNYRRMQWTMQAEVDPSDAALAHDTMRGLKRQNFWVMEQQAGPGGWEIVSVAPRPGELRLWAYQGIAHGGDGIVFFRWRTARFGTEEYWHGLLDHDAHPRRRYHEIKRMGAEIKQAGEQIHGSQIKPVMAILLSYDSRFAFQIQPNNPQFNYPDYFRWLYRAFYRYRIPIDVIAPTGDLSAYKLVVVPALYVLSPAEADNLKRFVQNGGVLVVTFRSGVKDKTNTVVDQPLPGLLAELCGVEVEEYDSLAADMSNGVEFVLPELASAGTIPVGVWCDVLKPNGATVVARYTQDYYAGQPAITLNRFGRGQVVYIGTLGDDNLHLPLAGWLLNLAGLKPGLDVPAGVEVAERWQGNQRLLFVLNHTQHEQQVKLARRYRNIVNGAETLEGNVSLPPREVLILVEER
jgi:beta-galactosidase